MLVSSSKVFQFLLDDYSAEIVLLGCVVQHPDYVPALSSYGKLAACKVRKKKKKKRRACYGKRYQVARFLSRLCHLRHMLRERGTVCCCFFFEESESETI